METLRNNIFGDDTESEGLIQYMGKDLTLCGKINAIKMIITPQLSPMTILLAIFKRYEGHTQSFLWDGKRKIIKLSK